MAEDIRQNFAADSAVTISLDSLANGSSEVSSAVDLGAVAPFALSLEIKLDGASASNTGLCEIYAQFSNDNSDFSDSDNDLLVGAVQMNGTTAVIKVMSMPVLARYVKLRVANASGAALESSGNAIRYAPVSVDQA
jgi:hypothetical protein